MGTATIFKSEGECRMTHCNCCSNGEGQGDWSGFSLDTFFAPLGFPLPGCAAGTLALFCPEVDDVVFGD